MTLLNSVILGQAEKYINFNNRDKNLVFLLVIVRGQAIRCLALFIGVYILSFQHEPAIKIKKGFQTGRMKTFLLNLKL